MKHDRTAPVKFFAAAGLLFLLSAGATVYLCRTMSGDMAMPGGWVMSMAWMRMPGQSWPAAFASFAGMWVLMMVAMMMPSLTLMLWGLRREGVGRLTLLVGAGYFAVWAVAGMVVYPLGIALTTTAMRWPALARSEPLATGLILVCAGSVQFSAWKTRWLESCRAESADGPHLSHDGGSACRRGVDLGVRCLLCCANLMMVLLVTGVMDLGAMALVTAAITFERAVPWPRRAARLTGLVIVAVGMVMVGGALRRT